MAGARSARCSGAQTQTSSLSCAGDLLQHLDPGAWMPSSFEIRMRARADRSAAYPSALMTFQPAHIGPQRHREWRSSRRLLVILHHRDQRAADRQAGAVQRVDEAREPSPPRGRVRAFIRRAWKSPQFEQLEISR
jgi:hypothetical protein